MATLSDLRNKAGQYIAGIGTALGGSTQNRQTALLGGKGLAATIGGRSTPYNTAPTYYSTKQAKAANINAPQTRTASGAVQYNYTPSGGSTGGSVSGQPSFQAVDQGGQQQQSQDQGGGFDQAEYERQLNEQINTSYNPAFERLSALEADYRAQFPTAQAEIEQSFNSVLPQLQQEQSTRLGDVAAQRREGQMEEKNQFAKARQLYNELKQSGLTRFGGASSTGEAAQELLGRETAKQFGDIGQQFTGYNQDLDKEEARINTYYTQKQTALEQEKQIAIQKARDTFDSKIREINSQRNALEQEKAAKRLGALQEVSNQIRQIQQEANAFQTELNNWKAFRDEALATAKQFGANKVSIPGYKGGTFSMSAPTGTANRTASSFAKAQGVFTGDEEEDKYFDFST